LEIAVIAEESAAVSPKESEQAEEEQFVSAESLLLELESKEQENLTNIMTNTKANNKRRMSWAPENSIAHFRIFDKENAPAAAAVDVCRGDKGEASESKRQAVESVEEEEKEEKESAAAPADTTTTRRTTRARAAAKTLVEPLREQPQRRSTRTRA
jgi:hypothetical protein